MLSRGYPLLIEQLPDMVDSFLPRDDDEPEALVSLMGADESNMDQRRTAGTHYGSDDEDYDRLFMDVLSQGDQGPIDHDQHTGRDSGQTMDTSNG